MARQKATRKVEFVNDKTVNESVSEDSVREEVFDEVVPEVLPDQEPLTNGQPGPSNGLPVEDLSSIEYGSLQERVEVSHRVENQVLFETLYFDREDLSLRFSDAKTGILSIPKVEGSDWFKGILNRHGFTDPYLFEKNDKTGRILVRSKERDGYQITRRVPR